MPKFRSRAIAIATCLLVVSAATAALAARHSVDIRGGQTVTVADPDGSSLRIRFSRVVSDERCPAKVMCAWARPPVVALDLTDTEQHTVSLTTTVSGEVSRAVNFNGWRIRADALLPVPQEPAEFAKLKPLGDYVLRLDVSRGGVE